MVEPLLHMLLPLLHQLLQLPWLLVLHLLLSLAELLLLWLLLLLPLPLPPLLSAPGVAVVSYPLQFPPVATPATAAVYWCFRAT